MNESEEIFLQSGLSAEETATKLAEVLDARVFRLDGGENAVRRQAAADPVRSIGGEVVENDYGEEDPSRVLYDRHAKRVAAGLEAPHTVVGRGFDEPDELAAAGGVP